jgi:1,4-dihydroxy-2-naphthoyl-CoA synthase
VRLMLDNPSSRTPEELAKEPSLIALDKSDSSMEAWCREVVESNPKSRKLFKWAMSMSLTGLSEE